MNTGTLNVTVTKTSAACPVGEIIGRAHAALDAIPVLSCDGPCIRGEIARMAANRIAREPGFGRACSGPLFTAPHSAIAFWVRHADAVVVIDGCQLRCHGRVLENLIPHTRLRAFEAASHHRRFGDVFASDTVPEAERREVAEDVAQWVIAKIRKPELLPAARLPGA